MIKNYNVRAFTYIGDPQKILNCVVYDPTNPAAQPETHDLIGGSSNNVLVSFDGIKAPQGQLITILAQAIWNNPVRLEATFDNGQLTEAHFLPIKAGS